MSDVLMDNMLSNHKFLICLDTPTSVSNERPGGDEEDWQAPEQSKWHLLLYSSTPVCQHIHPSDAHMTIFVSSSSLSWI